MRTKNTPSKTDTSNEIPPSIPLQEKQPLLGSGGENVENNVQRSPIEVIQIDDEGETFIQKPAPKKRGKSPLNENSDQHQLAVKKARNTKEREMGDHQALLESSDQQLEEINQDILESTASGQQGNAAGAEMLEEQVIWDTRLSHEKSNSDFASDNDEDDEQSIFTDWETDSSQSREGRVIWDTRLSHEKSNANSDNDENNEEDTSVDTESNSSECSSSEELSATNEEDEDEELDETTEAEEAMPPSVRVKEIKVDPMLWQKSEEEPMADVEIDDQQPQELDNFDQQLEGISPAILENSASDQQGSAANFEVEDSQAKKSKPDVGDTSISEDLKVSQAKEEKSAISETEFKQKQQESENFALFPGQVQREVTDAAREHLKKTREGLFE